MLVQAMTRGQGLERARMTTRRALAILLMVTLPLSVAASGENILPGDVAVTRFFQGIESPVARDLADFGNWFGSARAAAILGSVLLLALVVARRWSEAALFTIANLLRAASPVLKALCESPRPTSDLVRVDAPVSGWGFPSGHAMGATLLCGSIIWITLRLHPPRWLRWSVITASGALTAGTGFARIYVGAHWPTDVLGGYLWGTILVLAAVEGFRTLTGTPRPLQQPTAPRSTSRSDPQHDQLLRSPGMQARFPWYWLTNLAGQRQWTRNARWSVASLSALLALLIIGRITTPQLSVGTWTFQPDFSRYWWYQLFQITLALLLLVTVDSVFAHYGGLSRITHMMIVSAAYADALGNVAHGYRTFDWYDKALHAYTGATFTFAVHDVLRVLTRFYLRTSWLGRRWIPAAGSIALAGIAWELYEYLGDITLHTERVRDWRDTANDLLAASCGALVASVVLHVLAAREQPEASPRVGMERPALDATLHQQPPQSP